MNVTIDLLHPASVAITAEQIAHNKVYPLLREINHRYGLKVLGMKVVNMRVTDALVLGNESGFPVGLIYYANQTDEYTIETAIRLKDRGRTQQDKRTYFSKKVPSLMKTIAKEGLLPKDNKEFIAESHGGFIREFVSSFTSKYNGIHKSNNMDAEDLHNILKVIARTYENGEQPTKEFMDKIKPELDKYNQIDSMRSKRANELVEKLSNPFYFIMHDSFGFMVGKANISCKINSNTTYVDDIEMRIVEDFKRINDVDEIPELIPKLTMFKVLMQQNNHEVEFEGDSELFPVSHRAHYSEDLDMYKYSHSTNGWYNNSVIDTHWLVVPV